MLSEEIIFSRTIPRTDMQAVRGTRTRDFYNLSTAARRHSSGRIIHSFFRHRRQSPWGIASIYSFIFADIFTPLNGNTTADRFI